MFTSYKKQFVHFNENKYGWNQNYVDSREEEIKQWWYGQWSILLASTIK